jgi:MoaA/NifB/PqqE/SkfB family radical SAM enzyme
LKWEAGEAALLPDLPRMVDYARNIGVAHISITSNGTLPSGRYLDLVRNGIDEIRISIDARNMEMGAALTGRKRAWSSSVNNLRLLSELRREYPRLFLIANTVISRANRADMAEIVRFLLSLSVDDIKLITVVQEKESLGDFACVNDVVKQVEDLLAQHPVEAFPLLRRKLKTVFDVDSIGLAEVPDSQRHDWRCYIPLTERTVDSDYYYPCSVYLREGGTPLGRLDDSSEAQRAKTARFARTGNCLEDPICSTYCLHCTRAYNVGANEARKNGSGSTR